MRIIIEVDNDKSPTVSSSDQTTATGNSLTGTAQPITTVDGGAAPTGHDDDGAVTDSPTPATASGVTVIDGGTAPSFPNQ